MDARVQERFVIDSELRLGIRAGELRLFLQPQVDAAGHWTGAEVLVLLLVLVDEVELDVEAVVDEVVEVVGVTVDDVVGAEALSVMVRVAIGARPVDFAVQRTEDRRKRLLIADMEEQERGQTEEGRAAQRAALRKAADADERVVTVTLTERGTRKYPGEQLRRAMARTGSAIGVAAADDYTVFGLRTTSDDHSVALRSFSPRPLKCCEGAAVTAAKTSACLTVSTPRSASRSRSGSSRSAG